MTAYYEAEVVVEDSIGGLYVGSLPHRATAEEARQDALTLTPYRTLGDLVDAGVLDAGDVSFYADTPVEVWRAYPLRGCRVVRYYGPGLDMDDTYPGVEVRFRAERGQVAW